MWNNRAVSAGAGPTRLYNYVPYNYSGALGAFSSKYPVGLHHSISETILFIFIGLNKLGNCISFLLLEIFLDKRE